MPITFTCTLPHGVDEGVEGRIWTPEETNLNTVIRMVFKRAPPPSNDATAISNPPIEAGSANNSSSSGDNASMNPCNAPMEIHSDSSGNGDSGSDGLSNRVSHYKEGDVQPNREELNDRRQHLVASFKEESKKKEIMQLKKKKKKRVAENKVFKALMKKRAGKL